MLGADRDRLTVYPEFALAALVVSATASAGLRRPVEHVAKRAGLLYTSKVYRVFEAALAEALREVGSRDVVALARSVASVDEAAFRAWRDEVSACADALVSSLVRIEALPARVVDISGRYVVEIDGLAERHPLEDAPQALALGDLVTRDRVSVASAVRDFLLPVPDLELVGALEMQVDNVDENELARALFDGLQGQVRVVPFMPPAREPVVVASPDVEVPWHLLAGANSMARKAHPASTR
jgi:hypothetical protein